MNEKRVESLQRAMAAMIISMWIVLVSHVISSCYRNGGEQETYSMDENR